MLDSYQEAKGSLLFYLFASIFSLSRFAQFAQLSPISAWQFTPFLISYVG